MIQQTQPFNVYSFPGLTKNVFNLKVKPIEIVRFVCNVFKVRLEDLRSGKGKLPLTEIRHIAAYMLRKYTLLSLQEIARILNRKNHTTIINSIKQVEKMKATQNIEYFSDIKTIENELNRIYK